jgi:inner membrane protein
VDPVCHTLVGAALAESGLKRRAPGGTATLLIGANLPDVDVLSYAWGSLTALTFRRGWTHGVLAMAVLPFLLALVVYWARRLPPLRARGPGGFAPVVFLAYVSVWTHPLLDTLNTYGMRWLSPLDDRWFYGDTLFIVDPWVWALLVGGVVLARRRGSGKPAGLALAMGTAYVLVMWTGSWAARGDVRERAAATGWAAGRILISPVPVNPLERLVILEDGDRYRVGRYRWAAKPRLVWEGSVDRNTEHPAARRAMATREGAAFLGWARFPFFVTTGPEPATVVHIVDARYTLDPEAPFGALSVPLPPAGGAARDGGAGEGQDAGGR